MSSPFVQHGQVPTSAHKVITTADLVKRFCTVGLMVAACLVMFLIGAYIDSVAEERSAQERQHLLAELERMDSDRRWVERMANAYAHGRDEALSQVSQVACNNQGGR
jgi:sensor domain CHASE-containing protein